MATYRRTNEVGDVIATYPFAKPTPAHALTPAAEAARQSLRDFSAGRGDKLTRADVEAAYVHPAPEVEGRLIASGNAGGRANFFRLDCQSRGAEIRVTIARGTTLPKWHVVSPASGGPDVDPSQYHGTVVDSVVVWARSTHNGHEVRVRAEWHDGRIHEVMVNDEKSSLKAALERLAS